jgi:Protein of unknown function (DUF1493)
MEDAVRERVFALVASHTNVLRKNLTPETTLARNLGMELDVAEAFFKEFSKEFGVPLVSTDWHGYFYSPGVGCGTGLLFFVPAAILSWLLKALGGVTFWLGGTIGLALTLLVLHLRAQRRARPQISIQDLVDSANAREWKKQPISD